MPCRCHYLDFLLPLPFLDCPAALPLRLCLLVLNILPFGTPPLALSSDSTFLRCLPACLPSAAEFVALLSCAPASRCNVMPFLSDQHVASTI